MSARATVVVPAHDEEAVIGRCLDALHAGAEPGEWEVVVAANGCTDRTVEVVRAHPLGATCLDLPDPGKTAALNAADAVATCGTRVYVDADVELTVPALRALVDTLTRPDVLAAAPRMRLQLTGCSALVRSYYRVWRELPVLQEGYVGSGVFGLSEAGHRRVAPFPDVVAEDDYVRRSFRPHERRTSPGTFVVRPARTVRALLRRAGRVKAGNQQLAQEHPELPTGRDGSTGRFVARRARSPRAAPDVVVFLVVTFLVRISAELRARRGDTTWDRDDSSRR